MHIKEISGVKMMQNIRYFEPDHILVSVIRSKNLLIFNYDETCAVWNAFLYSSPRNQVEPERCVIL
jgi:hypothetical protein